jgi:hypothetical protein
MAAQAAVFSTAFRPQGIDNFACPRRLRNHRGMREQEIIFGEMRANGGPDQRSGPLR